MGQVQELGVTLRVPERERQETHISLRDTALASPLLAGEYIRCRPSTKSACADSIRLREVTLESL